MAPDLVASLPEAKLCTLLNSDQTVAIHNHRSLARLGKIDDFSTIAMQIDTIGLKYKKTGATGRTQTAHRLVFDAK